MVTTWNIDSVREKKDVLVSLRLQLSEYIIHQTLTSSQD